MDSSIASRSAQEDKPSTPDPTPEPEPDLDDDAREAKRRKEDALAEKEAGNASYKAKDFQKAIEHYNRWASGLGGLSRAGSKHLIL